VCALAFAMGCSRTGLETAASTTFASSDAARGAPDSAPTLPPVAGKDAAPPSNADPREPTREPPRCEPSPETCNGRDDDCNGRVDDGIAAVPCPGGGSRYCVAGALTACPNRCEACVPGSERVCFHSYCTYWAVQACTADGKSFGTCRERTVPPECASVADHYRESPELERCCIDNGYCCHDEFDLDHDGDRGEMLGTCDEVACN
jgi:hypothetical protein